MSKIRLAIVISHPIQYATPLYSYLNDDPELEVTALFCSDFSLRGAKDPGFGHSVKWDVDLLGGYRSVFLGKNAHTRSIVGFWSLVCPELVTELSPAKYDVVLVHGQQFAAYVLAFAIAKAKGIPVLTRGETHLGLKRAATRLALRNAILSAQYRFIDGFLAIGSANADYYRALGVANEKIFSVPYSVDNDRFIAAADISESTRRACRATWGVLDDRPVVLYASKFMRRKHPDDVLRAAAHLRAEGETLHVVMAGAGEMEKELRNLAAELDLADVVTFTGFINQSELPGVYASSDVFVLPSEDEPWGLIVNEVMCAGIPVVVGEGVGCVPDLVTPRETGFTCVAGDVASLVGALRPLVKDADLRRSMGEKSRNRIEGWGYRQCKEGILEAVQKVCRASR